MNSASMAVALRGVDIREQPQSTVAGVRHEHRTLPAFLAAPLRRMMVNHVRQIKQSKKANGINHPLFDGLGEFCRKIKEGAASWQALDIIYNYHGQGSLVDRFWIGHMLNAQAVRNRKRIIVEELHARCADIILRKGMVRVLSLASGSAQAVFESLVGLPAN